MKRSLLLAALLALTPLAQAQSRTVLVNADQQGRCASAQQKIASAIKLHAIAEPFEIFVVCDSAFWPKVVNAAHLRKDTLAFTALFNDERRARLTIPATSADSPFLDAEIRHELNHIHCRCDEGDLH